jgi:hypothetical protein
VPEDKEHRLNVAKAGPHAIELDEWRALMGLKPVGGELGSARLVPLNSYLTVDPLDPATRPQAAGSAKAPRGGHGLRRRVADVPAHGSNGRAVQ